MVYEVNDFDIGDIVCIDTGNKILVGEILDISDTRIKIRKKDSLKAIVQADSIKTIEQITASDEIYSSPTNNNLIKPISEKDNFTVDINNIDNLYKSFVTEQECQDEPWSFEAITKEFKGQDILSKVNGIINSIGSALKNDRETLDLSNANNKTRPAIYRLKSIYSETKNSSVLLLIMYIYFIQTNKKDGLYSSFRDGIKYANDADSKLALEFFRRQGYLPFGIGCWKEYISLPSELVSIIEKKTSSLLNKEGLTELSYYVKEIYEAQNLNSKDANILLYGICKKIVGDEFAKTNYGAVEANSAKLRKDLYLSITDHITSLKQKLTDESRAKSTLIINQANNLSYKSYYNISKFLQAAKTEEEYKIVEDALKKVISYRSDKRFTAVMDLMALYSRKSYGKYTETIKIYEQYKDTFIGEERAKLSKLAIPAYISTERYEKCIDIIDEVYRNTAEEYYLTMKVVCYIKMKDYKNALLTGKKISTKFLNYSQYHYLQQNLCIANVALGKYEDAQVIVNNMRDAGSRGSLIESLQVLIDDAKNPANEDVVQKREISEELVEGIVEEGFYADISSTAYRIDDLITPFIKSEIEKSQYEGVKNRRQNAETGLMELNPEERPDKTKTAEEYINNIYTGLKGEASYINRNVGPLYGKFSDASIKWLTLAKISENACRNEDYSTIDWAARFVESCKSYLWLREKLSRDTYGGKLFLIKEFLTFISKMMDSEQIITYEVYDALNEFLAYWGGLDNNSFETVHYKRQSGDNTSYKEKQIELLTRTLKKAYENGKKNVLHAIVELPKNLFSTLIVPIIQKSGLEAEVITDIKRFFPESKENDLLALLLMDSKMLEVDRYQVKTYISNIASETMEGENARADRINLFMNELKKHIISLSLYDKERCAKLIKICSDFCELLNLKAFSSVSAMYSTIVGACGAYEAELKVSPLEVDYYGTIKMLECIKNTSEELYESVLKNSMPAIEVRDEYEFEGYIPQDNNVITLMLTVSNGHPGEDLSRATVTEITLSGQFNVIKAAECKNDVIRGGEYNNYEFDFTLQKEIIDKGDPIPAVVNVIYSTINNEKISKDFALNISFNNGNRTDIVNVYNENALSPQNSRGLFMGRDAIIKTISSKLANGYVYGRTIFIYGMYRSGKTSLKKFVADKLEREHNVIIADAESVLSAKSSTYDLIKTIIETISKVLIEKYGESNGTINALEIIRNRINVDNYDAIITEYTKMIVSKKNDLGNPHILLLYDEIGRHFQKYPETDFMETWKKVMETGAIDALFVGHDIITKIMRESSNPFGTSAMYQIDYIDDDATYKLIKNPTMYEENGKRKARFTEDAIKRIQYLSGGHVYYLQLICSCCIEFMNSKGLARLNASYVNRAIETWLNSIDPNTIIAKGHSLYEAGEYDAKDESERISKSNAQAILDAITQLKGNSDEYEIKNYVFKKYRISETVVPEFLAWLKNRHVIYETNGKYTIRVKFYSEYLNEYIAEEIG